MKASGQVVIPIQDISEIRGESGYARLLKKSGVPMRGVIFPRPDFERYHYFSWDLPESMDRVISWEKK